jgi:hypothetical protein
LFTHEIAIDKRRSKDSFFIGWSGFRQSEYSNFFGCRTDISQLSS